MISLDSAGLFSSLFLKQDSALAAAEASRASSSPSDDDGNDSLDQARRSTSSADDDALALYDRAGAKIDGDDENTVSAASLAYRRAERTTLQIRTQEGDVVRLKFNVRDSLRAEASTIEDDETVISEISVRVRSSTRLRISVQGDLNAEELAAIQSVVEQAGALAEEFFAGGTAEAALLASSLELNPDQLDQVRLRLSLSERLTYTQIGSSPIAQPAPAAVGASAPTVADAASPAAVADAATATAVSAETAPAAAPTAEGVTTEAESTDAAIEGPQPLFVDILSAFDAIAAFLTDLLEALSAVPEPSESSEDTNAFALRYDVSFKLRVFQSILISVSEATGEDGDETLPPIIDEALEGLAAQQEPALEATA